MICDDDLPAPGSVAAIRDLVMAERPAWLHLPHRWIDAAGIVVNQSPCPPALERFDGSGALYRAYGHWLTFGSAAVVRRDALAHAAAAVETANAYAPLVWFVHAAASGPCLVAPFVGVHAGTEITWADRVSSIVGGDSPPCTRRCCRGTSMRPRSRRASTSSTAATGAPRSGVREAARRSPTSSAASRPPACSGGSPPSARRCERDAAALEELASTIGDDERCEAAALRLLAETAFADGDTGAALDLLAASALADPLDPETWSDLGVVRHARGQQAAALEALAVALGIAPEHEDARANRAAIRGRAA